MARPSRLYCADIRHQNSDGVPALEVGRRLMCSKAETEPVAQLIVTEIIGMCKLHLSSSLTVGVAEPGAGGRFGLVSLGYGSPGRSTEVH